MAKHPDDDTPPWKRRNPRKSAGKKTKQLSAEQRGEARARARAAGRPYPNLVDNMAVARKGGKTKAAKKTGTKKQSSTAKKSTRKSAASRKK